MAFFMGMGESKDSNILLNCFYINKNKKFDNFLFYNFSIQNNVIYDLLQYSFFIYKIKKILN